MKSVKVLFVSQEITPYLDETNMSIIGRNLPQGIQERGKEIRTFMPRWGCINERRNQLHEVIRLSGMNLVIDDTDHPLIIKVASIQSARMQVYFIDNEDYFHRKSILTNSKGKSFDDNDERAIFFARGVLETVKKLRWAPDIIHCHGWFSSFLPILVKRTYKEDPVFAKSKVVYSVYNDPFKTPLNSKVREKFELENITKKDVEILSTPSYENLMQLALRFSDGVVYGDETIEKNTDEYIKTLKVPVLGYHGMDDYIEETNQFYDQILNIANNDKK
ncbi:MAG: glycogen/starch synthase [Bacteroidales bacterium]|nr:glycogen/starch synthase [Bacteroidales bacterium]MDD3891626.1 glycogen/starch synthase [Bacteroidales bacterium]